MASPGLAGPGPPDELGRVRHDDLAVRLELADGLGPDVEPPAPPGGPQLPFADVSPHRLLVDAQDLGNFLNRQGL
jgi:hypothetical protein